MENKKKIIISIVIFILILGGWMLVKNWHKQTSTQNPYRNQPINSVSTPNSSSTLETNNNQTCKTYRNTQFSFEFECPKGWTFHGKTFGGPNTKFNLIGASPEENGIPNPVIPSFLINIVTSTFADKAVYGLNGFNVAVGGISGKKYEYEFEGIPKIAIDLPLGEYHMILGARKSYEYVFNQILTSFKFLK